MWWAYTRGGAYIRGGGGAYSRRFTVSSDYVLYYNTIFNEGKKQYLQL
jgi:hypothetical protein